MFAGIIITNFHDGFEKLGWLLVWENNEDGEYEKLIINRDDLIKKIKK